MQTTHRMKSYLLRFASISPSVCPDKTIDNSSTGLSGIEAGDPVITITCTDNTFELKGSSTVSCSNIGVWSTLPTCEKIGKLIERTIEMLSKSNA